MMSACQALADVAATFVTPADIDAFAPNDPGIAGYIRELNRSLVRRSPSDRMDGSLIEAIELTYFDFPDAWPDPSRFRRFRVWTNAMALEALAAGGVADDVLIPNYVALALLDDVEALADASLVDRLADAFGEAATAGIARGWDEAAFLLLARLLARRLNHADFEAEAQTLAGQIIDAEAKHFGRSSAAFLWGCTFFDGRHDRWRARVARQIGPSSGDLGLLRDALLDEG
jgi:hypothetical protein